MGESEFVFLMVMGTVLLSQNKNFLKMGQRNRSPVPKIQGGIDVNKPKVAVVMGSDSDLPVVEKALEILESFEIEREVRVISAHRTHDMAVEFAEGAEKRGVDVIIAAAGKAAHLPGVLAALTTVPVIGIPIKSSTMDGLDSLLSIVQMPKGIPVATVAINGSENAALLAVQMLALKYPELGPKLKAYRKEMSDKVKEKDQEIQAKFH
jgi:5-(carboxyamino)imidazole ribonucleotide mutase